MGRAITPPNALMGPTPNSSMPTAAAVAAAAATAKIQAMDAVASNAVMGLENIVKTRELDLKTAVDSAASSPTTGTVSSSLSTSPINNDTVLQLSPAPQSTLQVNK